MTAPRRARRLGGRLLTLLRGRGSLEDKLIHVGIVGGVLFVTLVATLFVVQQRLGRVQGRLVDEALPAEQHIARLEAAIGAAFGRQAQVSSTVSLAQLGPLRDRSAVEIRLRRAARELSQLHEAARLAGNVDEFLAADRALFDAVERRHTLQHAFEVELAKIDGDLRALVEDSQAVAGLLRLEYVLVLRGISESLARGAPRVDLVRTAVLGDVRGALDDTAELANSVLVLAHVAGKLGLAASSDAINSLAANELPQIRTRIERLIASLDLSVGSSSGRRPDVAARAQVLARRFADIAPRIMDEKRDTSLVGLRRRVVSEAETATKIRAGTVVAAAKLTADTATLHDAVARQIESSVSASAVTRGSAQLVSLIIALFGVLACVLAGRHIVAGIEGLEATNLHLTELKGNLETLNHSLEDKVAARTAALVTRDRAMQRVLDSMHEGLATVSLDGTLRPERSNAFTQWFGDPGDRPLWQLLFPTDPERAGSYACGFQQLADDVFPFEVAVAQLPSRFERDGLSFEIELRPVHEDGKLDAVLLVVRDITAQLAGLRAELAAREDHKIIGHLLRDRRGFRRSIEELDSLVATARAAADRVIRARALHTLKGNAAVLGFAAFADLAHQLEDELETEGHIAAASFSQLEQGFKDVLRRIEELVSDARDRIDIDADDYGRLVDQLQRRAAYDEILALVESWQLEPIDNMLYELAGHARRLAEQMGKRIDVVVEGNGLRIRDDDLRAFGASLVHAVRNAIDHGIEAPEVRAGHGKPATGEVRLIARVGDQGRLVISVIDDGAGVDIERVRQRARKLGLAHETSAEVLEALFADGLTTRDTVSELSGRGVGTSTVRAACRALGGEAQMLTEWQRGTELRCVLPAAVLCSPSRAA
jgi:HPt (histidine-containing phosphotransfer) domain-containing protein/two-component sensor histidine kinase